MGAHNVIDELERRGLVADVTDRAGLGELLAAGPVPFYAGYDPTGVSLHIGNLVPISIQRLLARAGHRPIAVVGGATGMVGDPSGKSAERNLLSAEALADNSRALHKQLEHLVGTDVAMANNRDWIAPMGVLDFLRDVGKHITVNYMLAKDSVKSRIDNREQGISYTEFSYMLLQGYDFAYLAEQRGCRLQVGGSDQWGNITCGIELARKMGGPTLYGLVGPLLTSASGAKFGKTAAGTSVWLDAALTSPYQFYQYFINVEDADVETYLKMFTVLDLDDIRAIVVRHDENRGQRHAQRALADQVTAWVHSQSAAAAADQVSRILFGEVITADTPKAALDLLAREVPTSDVTRGELASGLPLIDALVTTGLANSRGAARRLAEQGGVYVNNQRFADAAGRLTVTHLTHGQLIFLRAGKKNYHLLNVR